MNDLISRQAVNKLRKYNLVGGVHTVSLDEINKLPSAEKTTINHEKTTITDMDMISRTDLLNAIWQKEYGKDYDGVNMLDIPHIDIIENMPSYNSIKTELNGDLISKKSVLNLRKYNLVGGIHTVNVAEIDNLPTYSENQSYSWCDGCKEYDTENHCCHRYSSFIRESLQDNINAVLEDIEKTLQEMADDIGEDKGLECAIEVIEDYIDNHISGKENE